MNINLSGKTTNPIDIPKPKSKSISIRMSKSSSPSPSPSDYKSVILRGAPYKNIDTVKYLISSCIPKISLDKANEIVEIANKNNRSVVIMCGHDEACLYCSRLIENGLIVDLE